MSLYINGLGNISPQQSWNDEALLIHAYDYRGVRLKCVEPDYEQFFDPRQLRRMSRIIKMGITAAHMALKQAGVENPDGIITGTGYGCLEDTGTFLTRMVENEEEALNPTPFIQSTHNTIGSTIAMILQCQGYNQTYAHGAASFESCILDAMMQCEDNPALKLLIGGVDEITDISHTIQNRFGIFRRKLASTVKIFQNQKKGFANGEGAVFFLTSGSLQKNSIACIQDIEMLYKPSPTILKDRIEVFIREAGITPADVDLVMLGKSGNKASDQELDELCKAIFPKSGVGVFKHLCGEYPTSSAFAVWLAARIIQERRVPEVVQSRFMSRAPRKILILNAYMQTHYSFTLMNECRATT